MTYTQNQTLTLGYCEEQLVLKSGSIHLLLVLQITYETTLYHIADEYD